MIDVTYVSRCLFLVAALCAPATLHAHGDLHPRIAAVTQLLAKDPKNAAHYLQRGDLRRAHGELRLALEDYERAATLDATLGEIYFGRGAAQLSLGEAQAARESLQLYVARQTNSARGHLMLARAETALGAFGAAAASYRRAIANQERPQPEHYLQLSRVLWRDTRRREALAALDAGLVELRQPIALTIEAIRLEEQLGDTESALTRLVRLADASQRPERWLAWSGRILDGAGRIDEARQHFLRAQEALARLPVSRRRAAATERLAQEISAWFAAAPDADRARSDDSADTDTDTDSANTHSADTDSTDARRPVITPERESSR